MSEVAKIPERKLEVGIDIKIKGYEIDVMGIVSNIVYIKYFEDIRMAFLEKYYPFNEMMEIGISPILIHTDIDYKTPLTIFDNPKGFGWVTKMKKMRWEFNFEIVCGDTINAIGVQSGAFFDLEKKKPTIIPERLRDLWEK